MISKNIFENIPGNLQEELFSVILENRGVRIERIVSKGHASPQGFWYDQDKNEWVLLIKGHACLSMESRTGEGRTEPIMLSPGSYVNIPAHVRHRVEQTAPDQETVWLAIYY